jgi:beta-lactamase regulating signal transducer with metallopeptidase domain/protocatechuate 3,4-dioxygenase beta subunit
MNEVVSAVNGISAGWGAAIWRASWHGAIALAAVWGACRAWRGMPPHIRVWLWRLGYLKLMLGLLIWTRPVHLPVFSPSPTVVSVAAEAPSAELAADLLGGGTPAITWDAPEPVGLRPVVWLFALWLLGVSWQGAAVIRSWSRARQLRAASTKLDDPELERYVRELCRQQCLRPPRLAVGEGADGPLLLGLGRPTVLLPRALVEGCRPGELRLMLAHEVAHLKRRDLTWSWLPLLGQWIFFFHPLVWLAQREWRLEQEMAADAMALQMAPSTSAAYGQMLVKVVTADGSARTRLAAVGIAESRETLERRMLAMAHLAPIARRWLVLAGIAIGVLALVVLVPWRLSERRVARGDPMASMAAQGEMGPERRPSWLVTDVAGRVVTPTGEPVGGAEVFWVASVDGAEVAQVASTRTDAAGEFAFSEARQLLDDYPVPPELLVRAEGWALSSGQALAHQDLTIRVRPATELRVNFIDRRGNPVARIPVSVAWFWTEGPGSVNMPHVLADQLSCETDASGVCRFPDLPQGGGLLLSVNDDRFAHLGPERQIALDTTAVTHAGPITLLPGASIHGHVSYGPTGEPAAGIKVGAQGIAQLTWGETVTDGEGRYEISRLVPDRYNVALSLEPEVGRLWTARAHEAVAVRVAEQVQKVDLSLIKGAVVTGRIVAKRTGKPIADAESMDAGIYGPAHPRTGAWVQVTEFAPDGSYFLRVPEGEQYLYLRGTPPPGFSLPEKTSYEFPVQDGETVVIDFELPGSPMKPIHGRVLGPDGNPVPGAEVVLASVHTKWPEWTVLADDKGEFHVEPQALILRARHRQLATPKAVIPREGGEVTLRLREDVMASVRGTAVDEHGQPVAGAPVQLQIYQEHSGGKLSARRIAESQTGPKGTYSFGPLWPGNEYGVSVPEPGESGYEGPAYGSLRFELKPGEVRQLEPLKPVEPCGPLTWATRGDASPQAWASDEELLEQVRVGMSHTYNSITSCRGSVHLVRTRPLDEGAKLLGQRVVTVAFDGKRLRMSGKVLSGDLAANFEGAFDGKSTTEWLETPGDELAARIYPGRDGVTSGEFSLFVDPRGIGGGGLPGPDPDTGLSREIVGREVLDGRDCIVVEYTFPIPENMAGAYMKVTQWIDVDRGFAVPKSLAWYASGSEADPILLQEQVVELKQYGNELWVPAKFTRVVYRPDGTFEKRIIGTYDPDFQINVPISEDDLRLTLPSGMRVYDNREGAPDEPYTTP